MFYYISGVSYFLSVSLGVSPVVSSVVSPIFSGIIDVSYFVSVDDCLLKILSKIY